MILQTLLVIAAVVVLFIPGAQAASPYLFAAAAAVGVGNALLFPAEMPKLPKPADGQLVTAQALPPCVRGYGRARLGGAWTLREVANGALYQIIASHLGKIDAVEGYYINDEAVTVGTDGGGHTDAVIYPRHYLEQDPGVDESTSPPTILGKSFARLSSVLGSATEVAWADAVAAFDYWTDAHRGDGIAQIRMRCSSPASEDYSRVFPGGIPVPSAVWRLSAAFDPRDPAQSYDDPSTWLWSQNNALILMDFLTHKYGARQSYTRRILPALDQWIAAANICDEQVPLRAGGTEDRYHYDGTYRLTDRPADVIFSMKSTMDAWIYERADGAIGIRCGKYEAPTVTIEGKHIIGCQLRKGRKVEEVINEIRASFTSTLHDFDEKDAPAWRDEADISRRGQTLSATLDLTRCQQFGQVRRLMKRAMSRQRAELRGRIVTDAYGIVARGERYITIDLTAFGKGYRIVEIVGYTLSLESLSATIDWVDADQNIDDWDPATEEGDAPPVQEVEGSDEMLTLPEPEVTAESVTYDAGGGALNVQLAITIVDPDRADLTPSVQYRALGTDVWRYEPVSRSATDGTNYVHLTAPVTDSQTYEVQVRFENGGGVRGEWAPDPALQVTADASVAPIVYRVTSDGARRVTSGGEERVS